MLALASEFNDIQTARKEGLQFINPDRRSQYVVDPETCRALVNDPRFKLYTDRSLLKDAEDAAHFAESISAHKTAAAAVARYALLQNQKAKESSPSSFVAIIAPTNDVRFINGINGHIHSNHWPVTITRQLPTIMPSQRYF